MRRAIDSVKIAALASVAFLCYSAGLWFIELQTATQETALVAQNTVIGLRADLQGLAIRLDTKSDQALAEVSAWRVTADRQLTAIATKADEQLTAIRTAADTRTGETLGKVDTALGEIHELTGSLAPIMQHAASVSKQVDEAAPLFLDCEFNPSCAFNLAQGTEKAIEKAAQNVAAMTGEVRTALPAALTTWQAIGDNTNQTTANVARLTKPRWYDQVLKGAGIGLGGAALLFRH